MNATKTQSTNRVLMVEPVGFRANPETLASNAFQRADGSTDAAAVERAALAEHRHFRDALADAGVEIVLFQGTPDAPDACFCNNWFSTHADGRMALFPMCAPNRRIERRPDIVSALRQRYTTCLDLSAAELDGRFLEGTGSLVLDRVRGIAYAALSVRTDRALLESWCEAFGYRPVAFRTDDGRGLPYYHTNVTLSVGTTLAIVCADAIADEDEREAVLTSLAESRELLPISIEQAAHFCGNALELRGGDGAAILALSSQALAHFTADQRATFTRHFARIVHADLRTIERHGGGSARCLLGELF